MTRSIPSFTTPPAGYRLAVISPDGTIVEFIDIADSDPRKPLAAVELGDEIMSAIERAEA